MIRLKDTSNATDETRRNQNNGKKGFKRLKAGETNQMLERHSNQEGLP